MQGIYFTVACQLVILLLFAYVIDAVLFINCFQVGFKQVSIITILGKTFVVCVPYLGEASAFFTFFLSFMFHDSIPHPISFIQRVWFFTGHAFQRFAVVCLYGFSLASL